MNHYRTYLQGFLSLLSLIMISCGGAGGSIAPVPLEKGAGLDGTGGPPKNLLIGRFSSSNDSVLVNGVSLDTTPDTTVIIDGETVADGGAALLASGQVVAINASLNEDTATGTANTITFNSNVIGPISEINNSDNTLTVLGQTVIVNDEIEYGGLANSLNELSSGDSVRVSGFVSADNGVAATRIDKLNTRNYIVAGKIANLDTNTRTLNINALVVDYSQISSALPTLNNSVLVKIEGSEFNADGQLIATAINLVSSPLSDDIEAVEVEGFVTELISEFSFTMNNINIESNRQTVYQGGTADDLTLNSNIEVEGTLSDSGVLRAERIIFLTAELSNFTAGDRITSSTEVFTWEDVGADEYRLRVLSVAGLGERIIAHDEYYDGETLSAIVEGLPESDTIFDVILSTRHDQWWSQRVVRLLGQGIYTKTELTSHEDGDVLTSETVTFTWSDVDADEYRFIINNSNNRLFDQSFDGNTLSVTVPNLPRNRAYLAPILMARHGRWWSAQDYRIFSYDALTNARLTSHEHKGLLMGASETFTWDDVDADGYRLSIQSLSGFGRSFYSEEFDGTTTSVTIDGLPLNNARLAVRLHTNHDGFWNQLDYEIFGAGTLADAELTSHENLERLSATDTTLTWTEITDAEQYRVTVREVRSGGEDQRIIHSDDYDSHITSLPLSNLPRNGALLDVTIRTQQQGWWGIHTYRLIGMQVLDNALLTSHADNDSITTGNALLRWSDVGADEYYIDVYTSSGDRLLREVYDGQTTSAEVDGLPQDGSTVYVELSTNHDNWWAQARGRYKLISD